MISPASSSFNRNECASAPDDPAIAGRDAEQESPTHVRCRICRRWYQAITYTHLRYKHGIADPKTYKDEYSLSKITAPMVRKRIADQKFLVDRHAVDYIRRHWGKLSLKQITSYLGIDASTVRAHALRLGLGLLVKKWDGAKIIEELQRARREGLPLNSGKARHRMGPLYKAALKHFGSWVKALKKAGIPNEKVALRGPFESWSDDRVVQEILALKRESKERDYRFIQRHHPKLYAAARNRFGSWSEALRAADVS